MGANWRQQKFSKRSHGANTPLLRYASFTDLESCACLYVRELGAPIVVKAGRPGRWQGRRGIRRTEDAEDAVRSCFDGASGDSGKTVLIEECLTGPECSMLAFVSDGKAHCRPPPRTSKRAFDGDRESEHGRHGRVPPVPIVTLDELAAMHVNGARSGCHRALSSITITAACCVWRLHADAEGPKIIEFNAFPANLRRRWYCRVSSLTWRIIMLAVAEGRPDDMDLRWSGAVGRKAWCWPAKAIPDRTRRAKVILGIDEAEEIEGATVFHAGTAKNSLTTSWSPRAAAC